MPNIDHPVTPAKNKHISKGSIPKRIVKMPDMTGARDWKTLNPQLKGFKSAKIASLGADLPYREQRMVVRGPVGGEGTRGRSQ